MWRWHDVECLLNPLTMLLQGQPVQGSEVQRTTRTGT